MKLWIIQSFPALTIVYSKENWKQHILQNLKLNDFPSADKIERKNDWATKDYGFYFFFK